MGSSAPWDGDAADRYLPPTTLASPLFLRERLQDKCELVIRGGQRPPVTHTPHILRNRSKKSLFRKLRQIFPKLHLSRGRHSTLVEGVPAREQGAARALYSRGVSRGSMRSTRPPRRRTSTRLGAASSTTLVRGAARPKVEKEAAGVDGRAAQLTARARRQRLCLSIIVGRGEGGSAASAAAAPDDDAHPLE